VWLPCCATPCGAPRGRRETRTGASKDDGALAFKKPEAPTPSRAVPSVPQNVQYY